MEIATKFRFYMVFFSGGKEERHGGWEFLDSVVTSREERFENVSCVLGVWGMGVIGYIEQ